MSGSPRLGFAQRERRLRRPLRRQIARVLLHDLPQLVIRQPAALVPERPFLGAGQERRSELPVQLAPVLGELLGRSLWPGTLRSAGH
jgi:hypothetical protein